MRRVADWELLVPMCSDFAISHREPRQALFTYDGKELKIKLWYSHCIRTVRASCLTYFFHKREVTNGIHLPHQFLRYYLDWAMGGGRRLHVNTNRDHSVFYFQGPYYGYQTMVDSFYVVYALESEELINSPRLIAVAKKNSVCLDYEEKKTAWVENVPQYSSANAKLKET